MSEGLRGQGHEPRDLGGRMFQEENTVTAMALGQEGEEPGGLEKQHGGLSGWKRVS